MSKINFQDMLEFSLYTCAYRLQEVITVIEDNLEDQELVAKQIEEMTGKRPEETEEDLELKQATIASLNHNYEALDEIKTLIEKRYGKGEFKNWPEYNDKFVASLSWDNYSEVGDANEQYKNKGFLLNSPSYEELKHVLKANGYHRYSPEKEPAND